ncbi:hypothetical protein Tco_0588409 [Tanacetum coccineum]
MNNRLLLSTADQVSTARPEVSVVSVPVNVSVATPVTPPITTTVFDDDEDLTIAQALIKMRSEKAKEKGVAFKDVEETPRLIISTTTLQPLPNINPKYKELALRLHEEELAELERMQRERVAKEEDSMAVLYEEAAEIRSKPPTKTQLRNMMITYLKNMGRFNHNQLKGKSYEELQRLYEIEQKWINDFVPMDSEKEAKKSMESESEGKKDKRIKRVVDSALKHKSSKKQKMINEQEFAESDKEAVADYEHKKEELRMWLTVVPDEEETVYLEILSTKYPMVDWESQNLRSDIHVYKIIRADGNTSYHKTFSSMLRKFNRQDLMDLHRLVMKRFEGNTPEGYNLLLWGDLKKLYENFRVRSLLLDGTLICFNMLVEKRYPLIKEMLEKMLNWKLEAEAKSTIAFELLKFIKSQVEE